LVTSTSSTVDLCPLRTPLLILVTVHLYKAQTLKNTLLVRFLIVKSSLGFRDLFYCKVHRRSLLGLVSNSSFHAHQYLLIALHAASIDAPSPIYSIQPLRGQAVRRYNKRSADTAGENLQEGAIKFLIGLLWRLRDLYQLSPTSWEVSRRNLLYD
jgi:hypothetical protein